MHRVLFLVALVLALSLRVGDGRAATLFSDGFERAEGPNGVIANAHDAYSHECGESLVWRNDGGSWFRDPRDASGWSGRADAAPPTDCASSRATGSAQLRMWTHRNDFGDVRIDADVLIVRMPGAIGGERPWDGVKFYLHRQDVGPGTGDDTFYVVEPFRRDRDAHIQKKYRGRYADVVDTDDGSNPFPLGVWQHVMIVVRTARDASVHIGLYRNGARLAKWIDTGQRGGPPILAAGHVGFRGDNTEFKLAGFTVSTLSAGRGGCGAWRGPPALRPCAREPIL